VSVDEKSPTSELRPGFRLIRSSKFRLSASGVTYNPSNALHELAQSTGPLPPARDQYTARVESVTMGIKKFWRRVSDGMELHQLWKQFQTDARSSYRLYAHEFEATRPPGIGKVKHFFKVAGQFFWAFIEKLTPARRVLLLIALVFLFWFGSAFWGGLLMLVVVVLEVGDRVVMKRDLQIAKEIQAWLLPATPPLVLGLEIAFATRAANTVAKAISRPSTSGGVAGSSHAWIS